jgi:hypothetical protein
MGRSSKGVTDEVADVLLLLRGEVERICVGERT